MCILRIFNVSKLENFMQNIPKAVVVGTDGSLYYSVWLARKISCAADCRGPVKDCEDDSRCTCTFTRLVVCQKKWIWVATVLKLEAIDLWNPRIASNRSRTELTPKITFGGMTSFPGLGEKWHRQLNKIFCVRKCTKEANEQWLSRSGR